MYPPRGARTAKYKRISRDAEGRAYGIARQDQDLDAHCTQYGLDVVADYTDNDISASNNINAKPKHRKGWDQMLADARAGKFDHIVAYSTSRLTRRLREYEDLIELAERFGITYSYVRSPSVDLNTANGRLIARVFAANDSHYAEVLQELVRREKKQAAEAGRYMGGPRPFGYHKDGKTPLEPEFTLIADLSAKLLAGESLRSLANGLNRKGVRTSQGKEWKTYTLRTMLMRGRNAGLLEIRGKVARENAWEAAITTQTLDAVRRWLTAPERTTHRGTEHKWLGGGLYLCGTCGDGTVVRSGFADGASNGTYKNGEVRPAKKRTYRCGRINHLSRLGAPLDEYVEAHIVARLAEPDAVALMTTDDEVDIRALDEQANIIRANKQALVKDMTMEAIKQGRVVDTAAIATTSAALDQMLEDLAHKRAAATGDHVLDGLAGNPNIADIWPTLPVGRRAAVVRALCTVTVLPGKPGRKKRGEFDTSSVQIVWKKV